MNEPLIKRRKQRDQISYFPISCLSILFLMCASCAIGLIPLYSINSKSLVQTGNVPNLQNGLNTTVPVEAGNLLSFFSYGQWYVCSNITQCTSDANGIPASGTYANTTIPFVPLGTLIGNVSGCLFVIGNSSSIVAPCSGTLVLLMNDFDYGDNLPKNLTVSFSVLGFLNITSATTTTTTTTASITIITTTSVPTTTTTTLTTTDVPTTTSTISPTTTPPAGIVTVYFGVDVCNGAKYSVGYQDTNALISRFHANNTLSYYVTANSPSFSSFAKVSVIPDDIVCAFGTAGGGVNTFTNGVSVFGQVMGNNMVLAVFNAVGDAQWATTTASATGGEFYGGSINTNNEIYAIGYYRQGPVDFGNGVVISGGYGGLSPSGVLVKYNTAGQAQWAKTETCSGAGNSLWADVASYTVDGSVYAVGLMYTPDFSILHDLGDGVTFFTTFNSYNTAFITKYSSAGVTQWVRITTQAVFTGGEHQFVRVAVAADGSIYTVGVLGNTGAGNVDFGNGVTLIGTLPQQILIVKYDSLGNAQWARTTVSQSSYCRLNAVSVGLADGIIYTAGQMYGTGLYDFGNGVVLAGGVNDYNEMIIAYDASGNTLWARTTLSGTSFSTATGVVMVDWTRLAAAGYMGGVNVVFNGTVVDAGTNVGGNNRFLIETPVEIVSTTTTTTTTTLTSTTALLTTTVPPTTAPIVNLPTIYQGLRIFNSNKYAVGNQDINALIVKFDSNDNKLWYQTASSSVYSYFYEPSITPDGNVYAGGLMYGTGPNDFGNGVIVSGLYGSENLVLVKYNSSGSAQWARTSVSTIRAACYGTASDGNDSIYCVGFVSAFPPFDFGNGVSVFGGYGSGASASMLTKYNAAGDAQWSTVESSSGSGNSLYAKVAVNASDGSLYAVGLVYTVGGGVFHDLGNGVNFTPDGNSVSIGIIVKYDSSGLAQWVRTTSQSTPTSSEHKFLGVAVSSDGYVYAVGVLGSSTLVDFGNGVTLSNFYAPEQVLIVKYDSFGVAQWAQTIQSGFYCLYNGVSIGPDGTVYATGRMYGTGFFNFGGFVNIAGGVADYNEMTVAYSPAGAALWAKTSLSGTSYSVGNAVAYDNLNVYSAGYTGGLNAVFDGTVTDIGTFSSGNNRLLIKRPSN